MLGKLASDSTIILLNCINLYFPIYYMIDFFPSFSLGIGCVWFSVYDIVAYCSGKYANLLSRPHVLRSQIQLIN